MDIRKAFCNFDELIQRHVSGSGIIIANSSYRLLLALLIINDWVNTALLKFAGTISRIDGSSD